MQFEAFSFGHIQIDGTSYNHDVVIDRGEVHKRTFWEKLGRACHDAGIVHVSPHSFRHSYRAWLDELGTPITVQQRAMRHGDIRVTMSYGDTVGNELRAATAKVAARAIAQ